MSSSPGALLMASFSRSPHSPGDAVVTPQVVIGKPVAGVLMSYSRGCAAVLSQMTEGQIAVETTPRSPTDSASDGYHSDSDDSHQHPDRSKLVSQYAAVWSRAADEVLPALAALDPLKPTPNLKYKIVFSIVVVSLTKF
ncbi:jg25062 [Pararge aegeria aegeria]|uniref:Jg25062 protein n=1 Tax=Pararge aegeria aegeria TaxID=348720 RepID=A0A8S4QUS8_9NEOP|nr:jg25062 [Pararge aegeria aegeria]